MQFSKRLESFGDEIFASLNEKKIALEKTGRTVYNMSVGTPDFPVSMRMRRALADAAMDPDNWKYSLRDTPEMLEAVCDYYRRRFGVSITPDMVCSCAGTQEGMGHIFMALCDRGDTVILPNPCYPVFIAGCRMAEAEIAYYPMDESTNFLPDPATIPGETAREAKAFVVSLPSNPTGSCGNDEKYRELIAFAKANDLLLIHDNAYSDIIFDGNEGKSILSYEGADQTCVEFFSLSKSFNLTGARISFLVGRPDVIAAFRKLRSQIDFGMFLPLQKVAVAALRTPLEEVEAQKREYQNRRDALCGGLRSIGWDIPDSHGSMFVWAPIPDHYADAMSFTLDLLEKAGVLTTPGESFGPAGTRFVRFALTLPVEKITEAVQTVDESGILKA